MKHKLVLSILLSALSVTLVSVPSYARGGFSGGGRGGFSSGRSSGFSSSRPSLGGSRTISRTTTSNHYYGRPDYYGAYGHPMMFGGFGMGYGYSNGLINGIIIGNLMYPPRTTVYAGGGYSGNALMLPDGRVADSSGQQVGTYVNGQFTPVANGPMIAQPAPAPTMKNDDEDGASLLAVVGIIVLIIILIILVG